MRVGTHVTLSICFESRETRGRRSRAEPWRTKHFKYKKGRISIFIEVPVSGLGRATTRRFGRSRNKGQPRPVTIPTLRSCHSSACVVLDYRHPRRHYAQKNPRWGRHADDDQTRTNSFLYNATKLNCRCAHTYHTYFEHIECDYQSVNPKVCSKVVA